MAFLSTEPKEQPRPGKGTVKLLLVPVTLLLATCGFVASPPGWSMIARFGQQVVVEGGEIVDAPARSLQSYPGTPLEGMTKMEVKFGKKFTWDKFKEASCENWCKKKQWEKSCKFHKCYLCNPCLEAMDVNKDGNVAYYEFEAGTQPWKFSHQAKYHTP